MPETITAFYQGMSGSAVVTRVEAYLDSIAVTPADATLATGSMTTLRAEGTYLAPEGRTLTQDLTGDVAWSSSDKSIAAITNLRRPGLVTARAAGNATVGANLMGVAGSTHVTVDP